MPRSCAAGLATSRELGRRGGATNDEGDRIGPIDPRDDAAVAARSSHEADAVLDALKASFAPAAALGEVVMVVTCSNCCPPPHDEAGPA